MDKVEKGLFQEAVSEIKQLREANYTQSLRLKMFDDVMAIFRAREEHHGLCMGEDVVWKIEEALQDSDVGVGAKKTPQVSEREMP